MFETSYDADSEALKLTQQISFVICATCGIPIGLTTGIVECRRDSGAAFFCPNGHQNIWRSKTRDQIISELTFSTEDNKKFREEMLKLQSRLEQLEAKNRDNQANKATEEKAA